MSINLTLQEFKALAQDFNVLPIHKVILADLETPVSAYLKLNNNLPSYILESVEGGERLGRYSTVGVNPLAQIKIQGNEYKFQSLRNDFTFNFQTDSNTPFEILESLCNEFKSPLNSNIGLIGALAYDTVKYIEPIQQKKSEAFPEADFLLSGDQIIFDNLKKNLKLQTTIYIPKGSNNEQIERLYQSGIVRLEALETQLTGEIPKDKLKIIPDQALSELERIEDWQSNYSKEEFIDLVNELKEYIRSGEIFQIVPSQQFKQSTSKAIDSLHIYRLLRSLNPAPYLFLMDLGDYQLISSSPEVMVRSDKAKDSYTAILRPIAGTYRRGATEAEDEEKANKLRNDPKEKAEHLMLIDLARNDLGRIAKPGTVKPNGEIMFVEKYSHVLHMVSEVICDVAPNTTPIELIQATFPAGTLSGAPKVRAMQLLAEKEKSPRGYYGGLAGYIGFDGSCNTAMTIRTIILKEQNNSTDIYIQAGAGIVYDSIPESEYQETINKAAALMKVIEQVCQGHSI